MGARGTYDGGCPVLGRLARSAGFLVSVKAMQLHLVPMAVLSLCTLLTLPGSLAHAQAADVIRVRVLSYNIHYGAGQDYIVDLPRIARVIASADPDLVALQEVDSNVRRSELLDEPAELARLTSMQFVFGHNIPHQGGLYGNAVLSRWPIVASENHRLPCCYTSEQRGLLEVAVQPLGEAPPITIFATHLDYRPVSRERLLSARMINQLVASRGVPSLLVGDLNATPRSATLFELGKHWRRANECVAPTFPAACPKKQIDYVMCHPRKHWRVVETRVLDEAVASDHRPLLAVLELRP